MTRKPFGSEMVRAKVGLWVGLITLGLVGAVAYRATVVATETTAWIEHTYLVIEHVAAERAALIEAGTLRQLLLLNVSAGDRASYARTMEIVGLNAKELRALTSENAVQQRNLDELEPLIATREKTFTTALEKTNASVIANAMSAGKTTDIRVAALLNDMASEESRLLVTRRDRGAKIVDMLRLVAVAGTIFGMAIMLFAFRRLRDEIAKRFQSDEGAKDGEETLARVLMCIGDGVIATDADGLVNSMNRAAEMLTGWTAAASIGRPAAEVFCIIDADTRDPILDPVTRALVAKITPGRDQPWLLVQKDGHELPVADSCAVVRDAKGGVQGTVLVFRDISEAQRAKIFFRALIEKSSDGIALTDPDGKILYASPAACRILGHKDAVVVVGSNVIDYAYPDDIERLRKFNQALAEKPGVVADTERRVQTADGSCRWIEVIGTNMVDDPAVGAIVRNMRDITEKKMAQIALSASETQFARLSESGLVGIARASLAGDISYANDTYLRMLGYTREDLGDGKVSLFLMSPTEQTAAESLANEQLKVTGVATPWEKELVRKDGSRIPVLLGVAMLDAQSCIAFVVDLADRKRAEKTLRETEQQLRQAQKMDAIGRLAGGVAHDFNNLLSVILSYCDMLLDNLKTSDPAHADVEEIQRAGRRAAELTHQLLMFSRQQVIEPKVVDVNDVLSTLDKMLTRLLGEDIDLTFMKRSTAKVLVDPSGIEQVVMNLAVNARDAMPTGGKLTIETADIFLDDEYTRHHIGVSPGQYVMLAVCDSGIGMDATTRERIFEPFFTTKEKGKGTGLGLSTVFGIVTQSGGSVWVYSEIGVGTTFKVYLPRATANARSARPSLLPSPPRRGTETILLVEDEDQVRVVARGILTRTGYTVIDARTPGEAVILCQQHVGTIDLLLTDVVMPQMSGPELAKRLAVVRPAMRVLCMSGYTDDSIVRHGVLEAHFAFLQKPITPEVLMRKVREVLDAEPPLAAACAQASNSI